MCVIAVCNDQRLTPEQAAKMWAANKYGGGMAWREKGKVIWRKGLSLDEIVELIQALPLPYVAHFRIPSGGFSPHNSLTHPFPIQKNVPLELDGSTKGSVLFHNGHWSQWKSTIMDASVRGAYQIPVGKWSDSRAMAWMAAHFGMGMLEFIDEKAVVFGPDELELFQPGGWSKVGTGIWVSNNGWANEHVDSKWSRPPHATSKSDEKTESDKEDPQSKQRLALELVKDGSKPRTVNGVGNQTGSLSQRESRGTSHEERPFELYQAAVKLYMQRTLSGKGFKKERNKYLNWCKQRKIAPLDKPLRDSMPEILLPPVHTVH